MQDQVRVEGLLERRVERGDEVVREALKKADRVRQQDRPAVRKDPAAGPGIQGREGHIRRELIGPREAIQQGRLACVRVSHEPDHKLATSRAHLTLLAAFDHRQLPLQVRDPLVQEPLVRLQLRLTRTAGADRALHAFKVRPHAAQARHEIDVLRELDLQAGLLRLGPTGEDVEDELRAIDHSRPPGLLEVPTLGGREVVVDHDAVRLKPLGLLTDLLHLALSKEGGRVLAATRLGEPVPHDLRVRGLDQSLELGERTIALRRLVREENAAREQAFLAAVRAET